MARAVGIIPARFGSSRFPGKPLAEIAGRSLVMRTYDGARAAESLDRVVVATDDQRIFDHVIGAGGEAVMTPEACPTGTDRLAAALKADPDLAEADVVVNVQGDWPCLAPSVIDAVVDVLDDDVMGTAVVPIGSLEELESPSVVKCVMGIDGRALYFSRSPIPSGEAMHYRHLGLYSYRLPFLMDYAKLAPTPLQKAESLEQLKVLEHGYRIRVAVVEEAGPSVDKPEDIEKVEEYLCSQSSSS